MQQAPPGGISGASGVPAGPGRPGIPHDPFAPSPLKRIVATITLMGILYGAAYSMAEGTTTERFVQVASAVGVLVYLLTFIDILLGLGFLIACVAFSPELSLGGMSDLRLEDFLIPALLLSWIARSMKDREPVIGSPLAAPGLAYLLAMILSTVVGIAAGTTPMARSAAVIFKYVEYYLLFLLIVNNVRTLRDFKAIALFAVLAAGASALLVGEAVPVADAAVSGRVHGPTGETANIFGGFLILHLGMAIAMFLFGRGGVPRVGGLAAAVLIGSAVMTTLSRTSYAAVALALLAVGLLFERRLLPLMGVGIVAFLTLGSEAASNRVEDLLTVAAGGGNPSLQSRIWAWELVLADLTGIHLLLGRGAGSVKLGDVDSEYFKVLADTGALGLLLFGWALVRIGRMALSVYRSQPPGTFGHAYAVGFLIAFIAILIHAVASTSFTSIRTMEAFMILCGLTACLHHHQEAWKREEEPLPAALVSRR